MDPRPVCIYRAADSGEAHLVRAILAEAGIESQVWGENLPFAGVASATKVEVFVSSADKDRALELVRQFEEEKRQAPPEAMTICDHCGAECPAEFEICPECQLSSSDEQTNSETSNEEEFAISLPAHEAPASKNMAERPNPYASPVEKKSVAATSELLSQGNWPIWLETGVVLSIVATICYPALAALIWPEKYPAGQWSLDSAVWMLLRDFNVICVVTFLMWRSEKPLAAFGLVPPKLSMDLPLAGCVIVVDLTSWKLFSGILLSIAAAVGSTTVQNAADVSQGLYTQVNTTFAIITVAVMEEVLVRCYLLSRFEQLFRSTTLSLLLTVLLSMSFTMNEGTYSILAAGLGGLIYGITFVLTRRLWPIAVAHAVFNVVNYWYGQTG